MPVSTLRIDIWSDIACPWCWVGKRHLEAALERFEHPTELHWRAFELDPSRPRTDDDDTDYVERLAAKYRTSRDGAQQMIDRMASVGRDVGLDYRFDHAHADNTFDAHRLLHWSGPSGKQTELKERLFLAYMHEGKHVGDRETLVELAAQVGLDAERAGALLATDEHATAVRQDQARARELGVTGVPFFVIGGRYAVGGAQPADVLLGAIQKAWDDGLAGQRLPFDDGPSETASGDACGPDGCAVPPASE